MDTTMSSDPERRVPPVSRVEVITSVQCRRRWSVAEGRPRRGGDASLMSVSYVARRAGVSPSQRWKRRMLEGGIEAVRADEDVIGSSLLKEMEKRVREPERLLSRKTIEAEVLGEALDIARAKKPLLQLPS